MVSPASWALAKHTGVPNVEGTALLQMVGHVLQGLGEEVLKGALVHVVVLYGEVVLRLSYDCDIIGRVRDDAVRLIFPHRCH